LDPESPMTETGSDFVDHVLDLLTPWGGVSARKMFGGYGLYKQGAMFALVAEDVLYFKVDERNKPLFQQLGMAPFTYDGKGKPVEMPYWETPPDALDDGAALVDFARGALDAAIAAKREKADTPASSAKSKKTAKKKT
jgi:DNA transformation protein and related proteins